MESMEEWNHEARPVRRGYNPVDVQKYCVREPDWQRFRLSLKGTPTRHKLERLEEWYDNKHGISRDMTKYMREVQVGNYLGALRRGGQLDADNKVQR